MHNELHIYFGYSGEVCNAVCAVKLLKCFVDMGNFTFHQHDGEQIKTEFFIFG